jgi:hypothetical protein
MGDSMSSIIVSGDTSGAITLAAPAVSGTNTLTLPANTGTVLTTASTAVVTQAMLGTGVAGNGPAFSAYANASQSISNSTYTKVAINTELFDTNSNFDSTTNYRFTPTVAGYYQVNAILRVAQTAGATDSLVVLYKNGAAYQRGGEINGTVAGSIQLSGTWLVSMNGTTDYIELYGFVTGTTPSFNYGNVNTTSTFSAFLARAA